MKLMLIQAPRPLAEALAGRPEIELVYLHTAQAVSDLARAGVRCQGVAYRPRAKVDFAAIRLVREVIKSTQPDLVHAFYGRPLANTTLATMGMRCPPPIVSYRGIERVPRRFDPSELIAFHHPRVAAHACESDAVANALVRGGIPRQRCATLYNCVPAGQLERVGRAGLAAWDVPAGAFVVGTVATMRPIKGIDLLLQAAIECAGLTDIYWVLIGGVHDERITKLAEHPAIRKRVRLLGHRPDAPVLASGFDVFVMPSRTEALCRALLEAMSQQVCPVVSDAGGMKEVVRHGRDGLVVPREDVGAIARSIRFLHQNRELVARLAASACQRVQGEFTAEQMAQRALALYDRVLTGRAARRAA